MDRPDLDARLDAVAPLAEPVRRALYRHVATAPDAVGRDAAAAAVGVGRALAAFHLDRLVEAGLLQAEYRRLSGRTGPGAGRPAKLYRRADTQVDVTLPERREDVLAGLFATALDRAGSGAGRRPDPARAALDRAAGDLGSRLGREARRRAGPRPSVRARLDAASSVLGSMGFEAAVDGDGLTLRNCPFDRIARDHRSLVCGTNQALLDGLVAGLGSTRIRATFDPAPGRCCVRLEGHAGS
jgi:predicted ArsR family transcriptional regulator